MPTALIVGASRGIGHEFARQLLADGWQVWASARDDASLDALRAAGARAIRLDVARAESIAALACQLDGLQFDLAVYVAGLFGPRHGARTAPAVADFDAVMHTNVLGAMQWIPTIAPLVQAARGKCIVISSSMGSIAGAGSSGGWVYRASKAALNMVVKTASCDYPGAILAAISPGWVQTDMGGPGATISAAQSVAGMRTTIERLTVNDSGGFYDYNGAALAW